MVLGWWVVPSTAKPSTQHVGFVGDIGLKIGFDVSLDDHVAFARYQHSHDPETRKQVIDFSRTLMVIGPVAALIFYFITRDLITCLLTAVGVLVCGIIYPKTSKCGIEKRVKNSITVQESLGSVEYEIVDDGLVCRRENTESKLLWEGISQVVSSEDYSFIFINPKSAHAIPKNGLTLGDHDSFIELLKGRWQEAEARE